MKKIKLKWITGEHLIERWNLTIRGLQLCIQSGLPVYNPDFELEERGPIYNKIPNPDYDPNGIPPKKYIVDQNNLHDLQVLLNTPFPVMRTGLTKDQILNNLLFKLEDVEKYEKEYGFNEKCLSDHKNKESEFAVYDSIVNGELRPFLEIYSSKKHIEELMEKLWRVSFIKTEHGFEVLSESDQLLLEMASKTGDKFKFEFDETDLKKPAKITNITYNELEELFDIDIPPPPDLKAEYFLELIELEYEKIKLRAKKFLEASHEETQISLYANKNVQTAKRIAFEAHTLSKQVKPRKKISSWDHPDSYIIYILKTFLIRSILFYQGLFEPYLKTPIQDEFQLRTFLYGEKPVQAAMRDFEKRLRNTIYRDLSNEIVTLNRGGDTEPDYDKDALKILTLHGKWLNTVFKEAVSNGFIGLSHLVFLTASDDSYMKNSIIVQLCENVLSEIVAPEMAYSGPEKLSISDYKWRLEVWRVLLNRWVAGNFPRARGNPLYDKYLPLYCFDEGTRELEKIDLREKYEQLENKAPEEGTAEFALKEYLETSKFVNKLAKFIKLSELKKYFVDVIGIPLPSLLIAESTQADWDIEKNTEKTIHIPSAPDQDETTETKADDFVRNLRVYYESDSDIKIQEPGKPAITPNYERLGFKNNSAKAWTTFIKILHDSGIYNIGKPGLENTPQRRDYERKRGYLRSINEKLINNVLHKEFSLQIPENYKLYERIPAEGSGRYKFKFQVLEEKKDGIITKSRYDSYSRENLLDHLLNMATQYLEKPDDWLKEKIDLVKLSLIEKHGMTENEIQNFIVKSKV